MSVISRWVSRRTLKKDLDAIIVMAGARGSCKSGSALSLAYEIDRNRKGESRFFMKPPKGFELKKGELMPRVVFTPTEFLNMISVQNLPKNSCIVFDEVGVAGDSREFMSKKNRMLKQVMETIRSKNLVLFLTAPTLASFDTSFRRSMSLYIRCLGQATAQKGYPCAKVVPKIAQTNPQTGDIMQKYMKVFKRTGHSTYLKKFFVNAPPAFLEAPYKRYKKFMQDQLYNTYSQEMVAVDTYNVKGSKNGVAEVNNKDLIAKVLAKPKDFYDFKRKKFIIEALQEGLGIKQWKARDLMQLLNFKKNNGALGVQF